MCTRAETLSDLRLRSAGPKGRCAIGGRLGCAARAELTKRASHHMMLWGEARW